jgi:poly-gamma-glutamate capsule biosynthesis protein CapA/YwtB (metallophosphatase superfamily)
MLLAMIGDVMLGRGVAEEIAQRPPNSFWGDTLPLLRRADLVVAGLECAITTHPVPWTHTPKIFHFRAPPAAVDVLRAAGVRLVALANNHTLDFEVAGLLDTIASLDAAGIAHAGAGPNLAAARNPAIVETAGLRVGMVAFTDNEPGWVAGPDQPGTNYIAIRSDPPTLQVVAQAAADARAQGAQVVLLSLHWGPNMRTRPPKHFRAFARAALERGVDLVYGHSAHIFQGIEVAQGKPILYDTGDFLDDYAVDPVLRNDRSLIFFADVDAQGVHELWLVPVRLKYAVVNRASGADLEAICTRMRALSAELGTAVERMDSVLRVAVRSVEGTWWEVGRS